MKLFGMLFGRGRTEAKAPGPQAEALQVSPESEYRELVRLICAGDLVSGVRRRPHYPEKYSTYAVGTLLEAYAQKRKPEDLVRVSDLSGEDLLNATERLKVIL